MGAEGNFTASVDHLFSVVNGALARFFFFDVFFWTDSFKFPVVIFALSVCGVFFTLKMRFVNIRLFAHAVRLVFGGEGGRQTQESAGAGEISRFKALTTALSATVGLGNIAGVAVAISVGGPGAAFWMMAMGFLGMSTKFAECALGVMYREKRADGKLMGGPMEYLKKGLAELGFARLGKWLAVFFSICCVLGSFGGGMAFQVNQSLNAISISLPFLNDYNWVYGLVLMVLAGAVIIGGLKRIAEVSGRVVPGMCFLYLCMAVFVLALNYREIPRGLLVIFQGAFSLKAGLGGFMGVLITGFQRGAFSNEAGLGSSPIAHSAAKVSHPVEEGAVALLEPFIDTIVICAITALLIVVTGAYDSPEYAHLIKEQKGAALTSQALSHASSWFPYLLSLIVFLFAFSTIISWSYYGERCFSFLFGEKFSLVYKIGALLIIFLGSVAKSKDILDFCDLTILSMSLPNLLGVVLLSGKVRQSMKEYTAGLKSA